MKRFLISIAALFALAFKASACGYYDDDSKNYYLFSYCDNSFSENYNAQMSEFWKQYCKMNYCPGIEEMIRVATKKNDTPMKIYLQHLQKYEDISMLMTDSWDYPTAAQLAKGKTDLRGIVSTAKMNLNGKYGNRWALLLMRANMLLNDHQANISFYTTKTKQYQNDCYKDMMRNIYARDLLLTGKKQQAWDIYAEQNDQQSLLWSVRKFTNLAGIKSICAENPNAPVLNFLVQTYVNRIQALIAESKEEMPYLDFRNVIWGKAYAQVPANQAQEFSGFVKFAQQMAEGGRTKVPCMWMSAASLVNYFTGNMKEAKACIDKAMLMKGTVAMKDNARRIRMVVETDMADVSSEEFKAFMAQELRWLDGQAKGAAGNAEAEARVRIIKHCLAEQYEKRGDDAMHLALCAVTDFNWYDENSEWYGDRFDYSSASFRLINGMSSEETMGYFDMLDKPGDAMQRYVAERLATRYDANVRNDLLGTKLIAENRPAEALDYLQRVDHGFLEDQAIAYYVCQRNYKKPFWDGRQELNLPMFDDNGDVIKHKLKGNVKVDFCKDIIALQNKYGAADTDSRRYLAYQLATHYYQASYKGNCWFLTHYGQSVMDSQNPKEANFPEIARKYLAEAATSEDTNLRMSALFGQVGIAPDQWITYEYNDNYDLIPQIHRNSKQYMALKTLDDYTHEIGFEKTFVSKCDVIKMFRENR